MKSDTEINIELAKALGWVPYSNYALAIGQFLQTETNVICNKDGYMRTFNYRDPVVFVAICKHWGLVVSHSNSYDCYATVQRLNVLSHSSDCVEKAAALCAIDLAKRGIKQ